MPQNHRDVFAVKRAFENAGFLAGRAERIGNRLFIIVRSRRHNGRFLRPFFLPGCEIIFLTVRSTQKIHIGLTNLVSQWSDPDGDTLSLTNITPTTTNGYTLSLSFAGGTNSMPVTTNDVNFTNYSIGYSNSLSVNDRFGYTISDGYDSASGFVYVFTNISALFGQTGTIGYTNISPTLQFYGVAGLTYVVQRSPDLSPGSWVDISTNTPAVGPFTVTDTNNPSAFYRLKY